MKNNDSKVIKKASLPKRIIAAVMDGAVALFTFFALVLFVFAPISNKCFHYNDKIDEGTALQLKSHLYVENEEKTSVFPVYEASDVSVSFLNEKLKYYYLNYKTGVGIETSDAAPDYNVLITLDSGEEVLPKDKYTESWFNSTFTETMSLDEYKDATVDALLDFEKYIEDIRKHVRLCELFMYMPSFFLTFGGYFILVPLLYKNGETFGKKVTQIGLLTVDGYSIKKRQVIARQLFLLIYVFLFAFGIGIGATSFATLGLGGAIYFIAIAINRKNRSLADLLAYTLPVNTRDSVWYESPESEENYNKQVENNLKKYKKYKAENKHILQVGSKVIDEDAKRELEEIKNQNNPDLDEQNH